MITAISFNDNIKMPSERTFYGFALGFHALALIWNPTLMSGGAANHAPVLMQVEFRDKLPVLPKPTQIARRIEPKPVVKKAHKSGLSLARAHTAPVTVHPHKNVTKLVSRPAPRSHPSPVKMPKFIPHASDEDALVTAARPARLATTTALRPASNPFQSGPVLKSKTRGIRASDVHFELADRGAFNAGSGQVVNIPIGEESGETAVVASAPGLHDAPKGLRHISGYYANAPLGEGVGVLAGKNRSGYHGTIQVGEPSDEEVVAAGNVHARGSAAGQGFEIGGPVGDRRILRRHVPEYPTWAEEKGISAVVKIFFTVKADGTIRPHMRIVRSSGYAELDDLARDALKEWKFSPTTATSAADEAWGVITFRFTLA